MRYGDVMKVVKEAGVILGDEASDYATHSMRRGAATAYLMAGVPYETAKIFGRWRSEAFRAYVTPWAGMISGAAVKVAQGHVAVAVQASDRPRQRLVMKTRARLDADKLIRHMEQNAPFR